MTETAAHTDRILAFLASIGIPAHPSERGGSGLLRGMTVIHGELLYDPAVGFAPGDLLHEAGHIAVTPPEERMTRECVSSDGGEEMAAIAWSWAAAVHLGIDARILFHDDGYKGQAAWLAERFAEPPPFGVPLLAAWGMTTTERYPAMDRWLR